MKRPDLHTLLFVGAGAALGYAYYAFIGCRTGACPITSNPIISTAYGAIVGGVLSGSTRKQPPSPNHEAPPE
jgi:hypothetical protein